jgi:hypothetical protein
MKKIKNIFLKIINYWRVFIGILIGGVSSVGFYVFGQTVKNGGAYYSSQDIYYFFIIGMFGIGLFIGLLLQQSFHNKTENEKDKKLSYNRETIFFDAHNMTPEERWNNRKLWYKRQATIAYYNDELTSEKKEEILKRDMEISEIKQKLLE